MKNFISISEYLETNSELPFGIPVWKKNEQLNRHWVLGNFKDGQVCTGVIKVKLDPENMFVKI